jgi:hypothetical protein
MTFLNIEFERAGNRGMVGVSEQNARKWLMHPDAPSARPIPYAACKLIRLIVG